MMRLFSILVVGCKKHEEVADRFYGLMNINWPEIANKIYFCTDEITSYQKKFAGDKIIEEPSGNYKDRILKSLSAIDSEYVLLLLDDYYFTDRINHLSFLDLVDDLEKNEIVYCKLIGYPKGKIAFSNIKGAYLIEKDSHYGISLQPSIWKKDSLKLALEMCDGFSAWEIESSFVKFQNKYFDKCLVINDNFLSIKNGVLRGKLFPYTNSILKKNGLEPLNIESISTIECAWFSTKFHLSMNMPSSFRKAGKKVGKAFGKKYHSDN